MESLKERKTTLEKEKSKLESMAQQLLNQRIGIENELSRINIEILKLIGKLDLIDEVENGKS